MKERIYGIFQRCGAFLIVLCLLIGCFPTNVFATDANINYVSLGDSMSNGYCFTGYNQGMLNEDAFRTGLGVYGDAAYPNLFAEWLEEQGYHVNHTKLAVSAMRTEDLNYLLDGCSRPDDQWFSQVNNYSGVHSDQVLKKIYQNAVKDADVITMSIGNATFPYLALYIVKALTGQLKESEIVKLDSALVDLDKEQKQLVYAVYDLLKDRITVQMPSNQYGEDVVSDAVAYCVAGYILNYKGILQQMIARNPDVHVVLVGLMNTTEDMTITIEGAEPVQIGDLMDDIVALINTYMSALPAAMQEKGQGTAAKFYYAEVSHPESIGQVFDDLVNTGWKTSEQGFVAETVRRGALTTFYNLLPVFRSIPELKNLPAVSLEDVVAFENTQWESTEGWQHAKTVFAKYDTDDTAYGSVDVAASAAIYLGFEAALGDCVDITDLPLSGLIQTLDNLKKIPADVTGPIQLMESVRSNMTSNDALKGACKFFTMFMAGNGMNIHPTPKAHEEIGGVVIQAYSEELSAKAAAMGNLQVGLKELVEAIKNNGPDKLALACQYSEDKGYIARMDQILEAAKSDDFDESELVREATTVALRMDDDFKYVALGDGSAASRSYADVLKGKLEDLAREESIAGITFANLAKVGNTIVTEAENLSEDVVVADLITLGFSQTEMMGKAIQRAVDGETVDWTALLGEDAMPHVENALAKVNTAIDDMELNGQLKDLMKSIVEAYAYSAVEYIVSLPVLVRAIRDVNEDAAIVVIGMYNPMDGVVIDVKSLMGNFYIDMSAFSEYFQYMVDLVEAYVVSAAILTDTIDYVDARDITVNEKTLGMAEVMALLTGDVSALYPNSESHIYIAEQIEKALNTSFEGLPGDADNNSKINGFDLLRLKKYLSGENVEIVVGNCDINGDGKINGFDLLKLKKHLSAPEVFPL